MSRLGTLLSAVLLTQLVPATMPAHAASSAVCLVTMSATFDPALELDNTTSTMTLGTTWSSCAGTSLFAAGTVDGTSDATSMNCAAIVVSGSGGVTYAGGTKAGMVWTFAGDVAGGTLVMLPGTATVIGGAAEAQVGTSLASCALGGTVTSVTFTGAFTFAKV